VDVAANGRKAVEMVGLLHYDAIFMDCQMPEMDGFEATQEIRRREGSSLHRPIIAMTANAMQGDRERCLDAGMDDYVSKPIRKADLTEALERHLPKNVKAHRGGPEVAKL
jgi:CheY-like chemotaxis protein